MPKPAMLPDKDMTHTLSADSPYFTSMPKKDTPPAGTFKAGTKVLVMIPGAPYSKVTAQNGGNGLHRDRQPAAAGQVIGFFTRVASDADRSASLAACSPAQSVLEAVT